MALLSARYSSRMLADMGTLLSWVRSGETRARRSIEVWGLALTVALALSSWALPSTALACGGFFCSQSTGGQPVDQAGEDIVYILDSDRSMTMIVRIVYAGDPDQFAWILPVPFAPASIEIGPESLFGQLAASTSPTFTLTNRTEGTCREMPACERSSAGCDLGCSMASPSSAGS